MRITLSGDLGSGKSSVGKRLAEVLAVPHYSAGTLFREIGQISNLDALNTNLAAENNVDIDHRVDNRTKQIDRDVPDFVIDSRMAWHFVHRATKVYLSVSPLTAAERIMGDGSRASESYADLATAVTGLQERRRSEMKRYSRLYGVDITDIGNYDLFIITDDASIADIADLIMRFARGEVSQKRWLPKARIVPMVRVADGGRPRAPLPDTFALPLDVAENYGFFTDGADVLMAAFDRAPVFVPYAPEPSPQDDLPALARRTLTAADVGAWERAAGVPLSFGKVLEGAGG